MISDAEMRAPVSFPGWRETTMIYTHVLNKPGVSVFSPLDMLQR